MALTKLPKSGIADDAIDASKIEDGTIQAVEISGTIPAEKLSSTQDYSSKTVTLPDTSVTSDQLAGSIANAKLSNSTITFRGTSRSLGDSFSLPPNVDWQSVITASGGSSTASAGLGYIIDTTSGTHTLNLPASASLGDTIAVKDYAGTFATNNLTIGRNGHNIQGSAVNSLISTNRASLVLVYVDSTKGWLYTEESNVADLQAAVFITATGGTITTSGDYKIHSFTGDGCFVVTAVGSCAPRGDGPGSVDYLVVAGGGGGGGQDCGCGGGGAGGYRTSFPTACGSLAITATTYPITVGGGGAIDNNGSPSIFSTITSTGGGAGADVGGDGSPGGSGGGGSYNTDGSAGSGNTPPVSPSQGNPGGTGSNNGAYTESGGGGGGANASGGNAGSSDGGAGGAGKANSITGSPVSYAGGGGGGTSGPGTTGVGGSGGGGDGGVLGGPGAPNPRVSTAGSANTGGGGGGSYGPGGCRASAGGKGIVIIRYKYQ